MADAGSGGAELDQRTPVKLCGLTFYVTVRHLPRHVIDGRPPSPERYAMTVEGPCVTSGEFVLDGGDWWLVERQAQGPVKGTTRAVLDQLWLALRDEPGVRFSVGEN